MYMTALYGSSDASGDVNITFNAFVPIWSKPTATEVLNLFISFDFD